MKGPTLQATKLACCLLGMAAPSFGSTPAPWPVSSTYNSVDLNASVAFMVQYMGAEVITSNLTAATAGCDSAMQWVKLPGSDYEFHFISTPSLSAGSNFTFADYKVVAESYYGNLSDTNSSTYDQFMDHHVGMVTDDMTPYYTALRAGHVPFFMVGQYPSFFDLFVEIPGTGTILELTSTRLDNPNVTISEWDICQDRDNSPSMNQRSSQPSQAAPTSSNEKSGSGAQFPVLNWRKTTLASPYPAAAEAASIRFLGAHHIEQGHPGVWMKQCAKIAWSELNATGPAGIPYQFHFVDGYSYPPFPPALDIVGLAELEEAARNFTTGSGSGSWDEWANDRTSLWVHELAPYLDALTQAEEEEGTRSKAASPSDENKADTSAQAAFVPTWITRFDGAVYSLVLDMTPVAGHVIELLSDTFPTDKYPTPESWNFC